MNRLIKLPSLSRASKSTDEAELQKFMRIVEDKKTSLLEDYTTYLELAIKEEDFEDKTHLDV